MEGGKKSAKRSAKKSAKRSPKKSAKRSAKRSAKKGTRKLSPYNRFVKKFMASHKKEGKVTKLMKQAGHEWSKLTDAEKKKY